MFNAEVVRKNVPHCLVERPQWVCWKYVTRNGDKPTKAPIDANTGNFASSTNSQTWATFDVAVAACSRFAAIAGIGYVFSADDDFCGIDLDDCIQQNGEMKDWGNRIVGQFVSYSEISPSGCGVKIFIRATKPGTRCTADYEDGQIEMYDKGRFFTVTGNALAGVQRDVEPRQEQLDALYAEVFPEVKGVPLQPFLQATPDVRPARTAPPTGRDMARAERRAIAYLEKLPAAVSGSHGHDATYRAAVALAHGFCLSPDRALAILNQHYNPRCQPPWNDEELRHKVDSAVAKTHDKPYGWLLDARDEDGQSDKLPPLYAYDEVARMFIEANRRLIYWRGVFHMYGGTCYLPLAEAELGARIAAFIVEVEWWTRPARKNRNGEYEENAVAHPDHGGLMVVIVKMIPKTGDIREILLQLKIDYLPDVVDAPCWLDKTSKPSALELVACRNGLLHLPTSIVYSHSDRLFSLNAVDYDYDLTTPEPVQWLTFLHELFGDDEQAVATLQELFGYFLLPDTSQQKIALIVGPKRGGKGTIARVLTAMLGKANVCGPSLSSLGTNFGMWPLLHKQLGIISDARLSGRTDQAIVVERLLSISGEDCLTVDRKHLAPWTGKMQIRFLILTNELPKLTDVSGALASRFILLCLKESWLGREDHTLTDRLLTELPGVLLWAVEGWKRLQGRGHFVQPKSSADAVLQLEDLGSPIGAFIRDCCNVAPTASIPIHDLFAAWQCYCADTGRSHSGTIQGFGRDLRAALASVWVKQPREGDATRVREYQGVALSAEGDHFLALARMARESNHCTCSESK